MNEYNEFVERDLEQDIEERKSLIEQVKALQSREDSNVYGEVAKLQKAWRRVSSDESAYDAALNEEFEAICESIYAKRKEEYKGNEAVKKDLISQAQALVKSTDFAKATKEMEELMNKWKASGSAGRDNDDTLWNSFNEARQAFFNNKHEYWEGLQAKFENARKVKEDLIAKAKDLQNSDEWQKTSNAYQELLVEWKAIGSAGKEFEDGLWAAFNDARQVFYDKRNQYYNELHEKQANNASSKKELLDQAKAVAEQKVYTKENTEVMKKLSADWKNVGSSGKDEDGLWTEFRATMDSYFNGLGEYNNKRQMEWRQRLQEVRARKQDMLMKQKNQIKRMQENIATMYSQREIDETNEMIEDKKEFIAELEEEIADIDSKLNK